jgi:molybdopterin synthase sulfur carrier subunit
MPCVLIPPPYRGPTRGLASIEVAGQTVRECIEAIESVHPGFAAQVFDAAGEPHKFVKLFVNGDQTVPGARVSAGDEVELVAAIAGG